MLHLTTMLIISFSFPFICRTNISVSLLQWIATVWFRTIKQFHEYSASDWIFINKIIKGQFLIKYFHSARNHCNKKTLLLFIILHLDYEALIGLHERATFPINSAAVQKRCLRPPSTLTPRKNTQINTITSRNSEQRESLNHL